MCHIDGSIHKTDKAVLTKALERTVADHAEPGAIDVIVYDGFAVFHTMKQVPTTFGNIALKYLSTVCSSSAKRIDVIFDEYRQPSIKATEHMLRNSFSNDFTINGSEQIRPNDLRKELRNDRFKTALVNFIIQHWASDAAAKIIGKRVVLVNFDQCYKYVANDGHVTRTIEDDLSCPGHEEADTKIIYHLCHIDSQSDVVIRCSDTDVLVIMLANICNLLSELRIWMDFGTGMHLVIFKLIVRIVNVINYLQGIRGDS